jgi:VanZ family protein
MIKIFRLLGWGAVALISVLSLIPGEVRPHVLMSGKVEHFVAYLLTSSVLALAYRVRGKAILIALLLSGYSGILEILQLWIPGRHSRLTDFAVSSLGACTGVLLVLIALSFRHQHNRRSSRRDQVRSVPTPDIVSPVDDKL